MAIKPVTVFDTFSRTRTGLWGTGDSGHTWNSGTSRHNVNGSVGTISVPANQPIHNIYISEQSETTAESLSLVRWTSASASPWTNFGPSLSRGSSGSYYTLAIHDSPDEVEMVLIKDGLHYQLNRVDVTLSKNTWYWIRFERTSTSLRAKIWKQGTVEPSSWLITSGLWTGTNPPGAGSPGFYARGNSDSYDLEIAAYYFYTKDDDEPGLPITDTFERSVTTGWGMSDSGHVWEGNFSLDPAVRTRAGAGYVTDPGNGYGHLTIDNDQEYYGFLGPNRSTNMEVYTEFTINSAAGSTQLYIGQRGTMDTAGGVVSGYGYAVKIVSGATTIPIMKKTSAGGSWTQVGTASTVTALVANTQYSVRFQLVGTTLQARIWETGAAEPGVWHSTGTDSAITIGRAFVMMTQNTGTTTSRQIRLYRFEHTTPTPQATTIHTTTGAITATTTTDTSITVRAAFTNDTDADNSAVLEYKKAGDSTWTTFGGTFSRTSTYYQGVLSGLTPNTTYNVRVTFTDPDTVVGTNPTTASFTTTNTGIQTGTVTVTNVGASTIDIEATYTEDNDNNSTATLDYRVTSQTTTLGVDSFTGATGTELSTHVPDIGPAWVRHTISSADLYLTLYNNRVRGSSPSPTASGTVVYYQDFESIDNQYSVGAHFIYFGDESNTKIAGRMSKTVSTYYAFSYDGEYWRLVRVLNSAHTVLASFPMTVNKDEIHTVELVLRDDYKAGIVDGVEVCRSTDNSITSGVPGIVLAGSAGLTETNQVLLDNYTVTTRSMGGSWTSAGAMTADRVGKKFTKQITGLTADTVYEARVTYADAGGVRGFNPISTTAMTTGAASGLFAITSTVQPTSVVLDVFYYFDSNANSSLAIEYRSVMDFLWTTVPSSNIQVDRGAKKFSTILSSLSPNTTYQVRATLSDPDGFIQNLPSELTGLITTSGVVDRESPQIKHFLWKIYDAEGNYLETWHDAGTPEFSWHENGGVTDLRVTLPRSLTSLNDPHSSIQFQHRVDIWAVDPSSNGFGTNYMIDGEFDAGGWTIDPATTLSSGVLTVGTQVVPEGPDGSNCMKIKSANTTVYTSRSTPIALFSEDSVVPDPINVPFVVTAIARAVGSKLKMFIEAYDKNDQKIDQSEETAETVGPEWQKLRVEYVPKQGSYYLRVTLQNDAVGTMWVDKVVMLAKEQLIYRGFIERFKPEVTQNEQSVEIEVLGPVSLLSDDYIEFLQFIDIQPQKDIDAQRPHFEPADPADMMREVIRIAKRQNPRFMLYYTADSIRNTGTLAKYTFRDQQIRACMDKIRSLCPSGWHYYIEADGLVVLRGPEHATTHTLRLGVETMNFSVDKSIRNLKNYIHVKGRQDEDRNEPDGHGSIHYITFDQESIQKYGKRMMFIRDAQITDPDTAEMVGDGRLEEMNREEQRAQCLVLDEKQVFDTNHALRGYNIEAFRPGDMIRILDPISGPLTTYWDQFTWDQDTWDTRTSAFTLVSDAVPIKTVQYEDTQARLELSERQPSSVGDFGRLYRWLQLQDADSGE